MGRFVLTATELIAQPSYGGKMHKLNALLLLCLALVFAANVQAQSNSGVNNAELNGNYAFTFSGLPGIAVAHLFLGPWEDSLRMVPAISLTANWTPTAL